jgi:hypothetical protein
MTNDLGVLEQNYQALKNCFDKAQLLVWAALEARSQECGSVAPMVKVTGLSRRTVHRGLMDMWLKDTAGRHQNHQNGVCGFAVETGSTFGTMVPIHTKACIGGKFVHLTMS